jgi:hypothetical protein
MKQLSVSSTTRTSELADQNSLSQFFRDSLEISPPA